MVEAGVPGYDTSTWGGFLVPAGTPKEIVAKLNTGINAALVVPEVKDKLAAVGITVHGGTPEEFGQFLLAETDKWAQVASSASIVPE